MSFVLIPTLAQAQTVETMTAEACKILLEERRELVQTGALENMRRGPAWAQTNLSAKQIGEVGALIKLEEQLKFRCPVGFDNAVVVNIRAGRDAAPPPLPIRLPAELASVRAKLIATRRAKPAAATDAPPLPARNRKRGSARASKPRLLRGSLATRQRAASLPQAVVGSRNLVNFGIRVDGN